MGSEYQLLKKQCMGFRKQANVLVGGDIMQTLLWDTA